MRYLSSRLLSGLLFGIGFLLLAAPSASASECDLYTSSSQCVYSNGSLMTYFMVSDPHPTGTGFIDSFLRVQQNGSEEGFNTSYRGSGADKGITCDNGGCDDKTDPNYTENLLTTAVPIVNYNGGTY